MIRTQGLTRHFRIKKETIEAVRGVDIEVRDWRDGGAARPERRRQEHDAAHADHAAAAHLGPRPRSPACDVRADPAGVRRRIGYIGQGNGASHSQRVRDELLSQGRCYGLSRAEARQRADELLATLDLEPMAKRGAGTLSGGQRRRLDIALGLVHRPRLLFLDEPSTGLDPHNRANLWEHILRLRKEHGTTIFMTTHYLDEADTMAERVLIVDHGRVIADDTPEKLEGRPGGRPHSADHARRRPRPGEQRRSRSSFIAAHRDHRRRDGRSPRDARHGGASRTAAVAGRCRASMS